jgi:hypothetical protein
MASWQLIAPLPLITLDAGCTLTVEAIDPDTGAAVTGVTVSQVTIYADNSSTLPTAPIERTPLYALDPLI